MRPQSPASSRLRPIRAANETANRTAACVNVGEAGGENRRCGLCRRHDEHLRSRRLVLEMGSRGNQILPLDPRYVADSGADVCHRQATRRALMRLIRGRRKQHCRGFRMAYIQDVRHSLGTPAPRSRFQTAPWPGRFSLTHPERRYGGCWSSPAAGRARHTALPATGSCARCP